MARVRYTTVKIPIELAEKLEASCTEMGYRSRAEMVDDAIRMFIVSMLNLERGRGGSTTADAAPDLRPRMQQSLSSVAGR